MRRRVDKSRKWTRVVRKTDDDRRKINTMRRRRDEAEEATRAIGFLLREEKTNA